MEQQEFDTLVADPKELIKKIQATKSVDNIANYLKQYDVEGHDVMDTGKRPDKILDVDSGTGISQVHRIPVPFQKNIVGMAAAFLCGNPIKLSSTPLNDKEKQFMSVLQRTWDNNKLDYDSKAIAKLMMSLTEAAEIWYTEPIEEGYWAGTANAASSVKFKLRMKIIAYSLGDHLYPVYNNAGDMIAFGRGYSVTIENKSEDHFDIYTAKNIYTGVKSGSEWTLNSIPNKVNKIPVIYYKQPAPEWADVQRAIDAYERTISNLADDVDYSGSPITLLFGEVEGFATKGERGKTLQMKNGADAKYLESANAPDAIKLLLDTLRSIIHDYSSTPDISIEQMKSLGTYSGIALKMLFLGAHLKASDKEEVFGKSIQRRINYLKSALAVINVSMSEQVNMTIKPVFEYYLPKNIEELITLLNTATGGKATMSIETAVRNNPFVTDPDEEIKKVREEGLSTEINTPL